MKTQSPSTNGWLLVCISSNKWLCNQFMTNHHAAYTMVTIFCFHRRHFCNMWDEQSTSLACGPTVSHHLPTSHHQRTMDGGKLQMDGGYTGLISMRRQRHVENSSVVDVKLCLYAPGNFCRCHEARLGWTTLCSFEGDCDFQIGAWDHVSKLTTKIDWNNIMFQPRVHYVMVLMGTFQYELFSE